jgi:uncharacterized protein YqfA (UPF0365 family)
MLTVLLVVGTIAFIGGLFFALLILKPWLKAITSGAPVSIFHVIGMRLRGTPPGLIVDALVQLRMRGVETTVREVETQYLAHQHRIRAPFDLVDVVEANLADQSRV